MAGAAAVAIGLIPIVPSAIAQTDATWIGGAAGNWSDATRWSTNPNFPQNGLPGLDDLYNAVFGVNASVTLTEDVTIERLSSTAALTLLGGFDLNLNDGIALDSASARTLNQATVNLLGGMSVFAGAGNLNFLSGAVVNNHALFEWATDADFVYAGGAASQMNNLTGGIFRKTAGAGATVIGGSITFNNAGTIDIDSGQLDLNGGTYNLSDGTTFTGLGLTRAISGTFSLTGTLTANQNFEIAGGAIGGTHTLTGGTWLMTSGSLSGAGTTTIDSGSTLAMSGDAAKTLNVRTVENDGTITIAGGGNLNFISGAVLNNHNLLDVQGDADFVYAGGTGSTINNLAGATLRKSSGEDVTSISGNLTFNNAGTIDIDSGQLVFNGGTYNLADGTTFTGSGLTRAVSGTFSLDGTITANNNFEIAGGAIGGTHTLGGGTWLMTSGSLSGAGTTTIDPGSTLAMSGDATKTLNVRTVDNEGTIAITGGGNLNFISGAILDNHNLLDVQSDADFVYAGGAGSTINNLAGATLRKSGGEDVTSISGNLTFNNGGTIDVDSGQFVLNGGTYNLSDGTTFIGLGLTRAISGTFSLNGNITADNNFEIAGAAIGGTHTLTGGTWLMTSGSLSGAGTTTIDVDSTLAMSGDATKTLNVRTVDNDGTITIAGGGNLNFISGAVLNNHSLLDVQGDADFVYAGGTGSTINNLAGATIRKSGGEDVTSISGNLTFNNAGTIDIDSGQLLFNGGTYNLADGTTFTGSGLTRAVGGTYNFTGALTADNNFEIAGGAIGGTHTLTGGTWLMSGGSLIGALATMTIASGSTLAMSGNGTKTINQKTVANQGTITIADGGNLNFISGGVLNNHSLLDIQGDADFTYAGGTASTINNLSAATLRKSAGVDITSIGVNVTFNNAGLVAAQAGTLQFGSGAYADNGGTLRVENGATIQFLASPTLSSGRLEGNGTFIAPTLNASGATVAPGLSAGQLNIQGNLNLGALATLSIEIGGLVAGITHDFLNVDGSVVAGGFLDVALIDAFTPQPEMSFTVVDATSAITGSFANAASGERATFGSATFLVEYGLGSAFPDRVILSQYSPVPEPGTTALLGGTGLLIWAGARRLRRAQ